MDYQPTNYINGAPPAINDVNLNHIETAVDQAFQAINAGPIKVDTIAGLKALAPSAFTNNDTRIVSGYYAANDGGGGLFRWNSTSTVTDNAGTVIRPSSNPSTGRWERVYRGAINVKWFGAKGDNTTDDTAAINAAAQAAYNGAAGFLIGGVVYFPSDQYVVAGTLTVPVRTTFRGDGPGSRIDYRGTGTMCTITNGWQQRFEYMEFFTTQTSCLFFSLSNCFECRFDNVFFLGSHTTGNLRPNQKGMLFTDNTGDTLVVESVFQRLGDAITTESTQNYLVGTGFVENNRGVFGNGVNCAMSIESCTFASLDSPATVHIQIDGGDSAWWINKTWFEGIPTAIQVGTSSAGPVKFIIRDSTIWHTTNGIVINYATTVELDGLEFHPDRTLSPTATELVISPTKAPVGSASNLKSSYYADGYFPESVFPRDWVVSRPQPQVVAKRFLEKIRTGLEDVSLLLVSDSTALYGTPYSWPEQLADYFGTTFPTHTVRFRTWNGSTHAYNSPTTKTTGTGSRFLDVYSATIAGTRPDYPLTFRLGNLVLTPSPDVVIVNYGHNIGSGLTIQSEMFISSLLALTETISYHLPKAQIFLCAQNPRTIDTVSSYTASAVWRIAQERGYGVIDFFSAFKADTSFGTNLLQGDGIHPNDAGSAIQLAETKKIFWGRSRKDTPSQQPSSFVQANQNLVPNGRFDAWTNFQTSNALPDGFATNGALPAGVTFAPGTLHERSVRSVRLQAGVGGTSGPRLFYWQAGTDAINAVQGKTATLAIRIQVTNTTSSSAVIQPILQYNSFTQLINGDKIDLPAGVNAGWMWMTLTHDFAQSITDLYIGLDCDSSGTVDLTIDRMSMSVGGLPREWSPSVDDTLPAKRMIVLGSDVSNSANNTFADVVGLSFSVASGVTYRFRALIHFDAALATTGSRWAVNGPASPTRLAYSARWTSSATAESLTYANTYDAGTVSTNSFATTGNLASVEGVVIPSASGTFALRFASEITGSAITAKAGSTLEWW